MNPHERSRQLQHMSEDLCAIAWDHATLRLDTVVVAASEGDELSVLDLEVKGFLDPEGNFNLGLWTSELSTLSGLPLWFAGLVMPFSRPGGDFCAVVTMDFITVNYAQIILHPIESGVASRPDRWEPLVPFEQLNDLLVVLRRAVAPQG